MLLITILALGLGRTFGLEEVWNRWVAKRIAASREQKRNAVYDARASLLKQQESWNDPPDTDPDGSSPKSK